MKGADDPIRAPKVLFTFNSTDDIQLYATGCDGDTGGRSTVHIDLDVNPDHNAIIGKAATGVFWGDMRLDVKPGMEGKILPGWAGFRNKVRMVSCEWVRTAQFWVDAANDIWEHVRGRVKSPLSRASTTDCWRYRDT